MKIIGPYGATPVVWLKSCEGLKGKLGLFVDNSCMIYMLWTFYDSTCKHHILYFRLNKNVRHFLTKLGSEEHLKEIHAVKQLFGGFHREINRFV